MRSVRIRVSASEAELAADALWELGAVAIGESDADDEGGSVRECMLTTAFASEAETDAALAALDGRWPVEVTEHDDGHLDAWRAFAEPVRVGERIVIEPAWLASTARPGELVVRIDPGRAFGSGAHATTRLVLGALDRLVEAGMAVLDVGSGSGILAVTAARLGATPVVAIDVDPAALEATAANAALNGVGVEVFDGPMAAAGPFELVVANLLAPVLVELAGDLLDALEEHGVLVVSGLLVDRWSHVAAALEPLRVERIEELDGWVALELRR